MYIKILILKLKSNETKFQTTEYSTHDKFHFNNKRNSEALHAFMQCNSSLVDIFHWECIEGTLQCKIIIQSKE